MVITTHDIPDLSALTPPLAAEVAESTESTNKPAIRRNAVVPHWHDYYRTYLDSFAKYGALSQKMLAVLAGHSLLTIRAAMRNLSKAGYVQYHRAVGQTLYYPTKTGLALSEYAQYARSPKEVFGLARHDAVVNTLLCNTILNSHPPQWGIIRWWGPIEAKEELAQYFGFEETNRSKRLNYLPDAYFEFLATSKSRQFVFCPVVLEVDLGTEPSNRVVRKLEAGIRTLAAKPNGHQHNLVWYFVGKESRFSQVTNAMRTRLVELKQELPASRFPQVLVAIADAEEWAHQHFPMLLLNLETAEKANFTGYAVEEIATEEFVGVSLVQDRVKHTNVLRTQIPALRGKLSSESQK